MRPELEQKLKEEFPQLFERLPMNAHLGIDLCFEHEDGWFDMIHCLSRCIIDADKEGLVRAVQVKEKFGMLRFYYHLEGDERASIPEVSSIIDRAEILSSFVCEVCGSFNNVATEAKSNGMIQTLCEKCWENDRDLSVFKERENDSTVPYDQFRKEAGLVKKCGCGYDKSCECQGKEFPEC